MFCDVEYMSGEDSIMEQKQNIAERKKNVKKELF